MIGFVLGIGMAISYIGIAWNGFTTDLQVGPSVTGAAVVLVAGVFLIPKTVGIALTPIGVLTPVAFILAWFRIGFGHAAVLGIIGLIAIAITIVIARLRPEATGRF